MCRLQFLCSWSKVFQRLSLHCSDWHMSEEFSRERWASTSKSYLINTYQCALSATVFSWRCGLNLYFILTDIILNGCRRRWWLPSGLKVISSIGWLKQLQWLVSNVESKVVHPVQSRSGFQRSSRMNLGGSGGHQGQGSKARINCKEHAGKPHEIRATMERDDETAVNLCPNYSHTQRGRHMDTDRFWLS